jgi:hypothetical protein
MLMTAQMLAAGLTSKSAFGRVLVLPTATLTDQALLRLKVWRFWELLLVAAATGGACQRLLFSCLGCCELNQQQ